jgi:3,4-dihydroxy 2-butanone 4-phosphate synthase/GTP cyclohydrolase II
MLSFLEAVRAFKEGWVVVLQDDPERENEGDLIIAAEKINEGSWP